MKKTPQTDANASGDGSREVTLSRRQAIKRLAKVAVGAAGLAAAAAGAPRKALASKCDNFMANCCGIGYADYEAGYYNAYSNAYSSYGYNSYNDYYSSADMYSSTHFAPDPSFYVSHFDYYSHTYRGY